MRPLILKMEMTVDGFVGQPDEEPGWPVEYFDDELTAYMVDLLSTAGVHAMGRVSYEGMAPHWMTSTEPIAAPMNDIPKAVFSRTLERGEWPETTVYSDLEAGIAELKAQDGGPVIAHAGAGFAQQLTRLGLIDEYRLTVHPLAFGDGFPLFGGPVGLQLQDVRRFPRGSVAYTYTA
ncbi:dihydrofolate reductase [Nakamurella sp. YIM 132087]|uniref:Dihydrofolate reductase n=1 Tax=Nakamurella alba TaxID=2665158 RepID=A0A7K1FLL9_9ACTN|nr:dihydrofolate reductase family protein [Nakamurella alba]MTD15041.1 dihydrofolate reductase [Nakamurella alba]